MVRELTKLVDEMKKITKCNSLSITLNFGKTSESAGAPDKPKTPELTPEDKEQMKRDIEKFSGDNPGYTTLRNLASDAAVSSRYIAKLVSFYSQLEVDPLTVLTLESCGRTIRFVNVDDFIRMYKERSDHRDTRLIDNLERTYSNVTEK